MPTLSLEALRFHYEDPVCAVFDDATAEIDTAWRTALIGRNGLGKSTLIGLIAGALTPYAGRVRCPLETTRFPAQVRDPAAATLAVVRESIAPFSAWQQEMEALLRAGDPQSRRIVDANPAASALRTSGSADFPVDVLSCQESPFCAYSSMRLHRSARSEPPKSALTMNLVGSLSLST